MSEVDGEQTLKGLHAARQVFLKSLEAVRSQIDFFDLDFFFSRLKLKVLVRCLSAVGAPAPPSSQGCNCLF